ncbi:MAG: hypothetical protein ACXWLM_00985 [Myxococcales bacterium]
MRLFVDFEVGAGEAARALRQAFDRDGNGVLDPGEQQALTEHLARTATLRTRVSIDGAEVALRREAARAEKVDLPASSTALLAVRVELSNPWPEKIKKNFFFDHFLNRGREVEVRDEDQTGHVPIAVECDQCAVTDATSGVADGPHVRGANTPLRLTIRF